MLVRFNHKIIVIAITLYLSSGALQACGPSFPNRVLLGGDNAVLRAPVASFREEIERIEPGVVVRFTAVSQSTLSADLADLEKALTEHGVSGEQRDNMVAQYRAVREALFDYLLDQRNWCFTEVKGAEDERTPEPQFNLPAIPDGLPGEFEDYLRGAIFYHQGNREKAIDVWDGLLRRPAEERVYRSTWAAFMIGKKLLLGQPEFAIEWFRYVRELAEEGFADSLGLASSSLGWEARAALDLEQYDQAIELYVAQMATGDPTALTSLQLTACQVLGKENPDILAQVAGSPTARRVVTAYVISHGGPFHDRTDVELVRKWLAAVEAANVDVVQEAGRLACAAYQAGEMELAERWVALAPSDAIIARWIRAKLLLRAGKVPEAAGQLRYVARRFPDAKERGSQGRFYYWAGMRLSVEPIAKTVRGELGLIYLGLSNYVEALNVLLSGGHWEDAAYVAERVLKVDELKKYVDSAWPPMESAGDGVDSESASDDGRRSIWIGNRIRYLLARRLARMGRFIEARPYYPARLHLLFDTYVRAIERGENTSMPNWERAIALWDAACIARYEGMELLGTEVEPDWFLYKGDFVRKSASDIRVLPSSDKLVSVTVDEQFRLKQNVVPEKRFHYRYIAVELAWEAADLLPDEQDQTARVLCIAGSWLAAKEPKAADRFYKAMVRRCGTTKLGKEADKLRWFPKVEVDERQLLQELK